MQIDLKYRHYLTTIKVNVDITIMIHNSSNFKCPVKMHMYGLDLDLVFNLLTVYTLASLTMS